MEYLVLPDLMLSGVLCSIDLIFGEFHPWFAPFSFPGHRVRLDSQAEADQFGQAMQAMMNGARSCNSTFLIADDESYLNDGMPLPGTSEKTTSSVRVANSG
jgi:hypothetical protein